MNDYEIMAFKYRILDGEVLTRGWLIDSDGRNSLVDDLLIKEAGFTSHFLLKNGFSSPTA
ncbi:MAG TPA: hypothetical protein EYP23_00495 [Thermoplasmata archaeon]|nr:hypothetical protein [Thermoplasmata archaeon]